MCYARKTHRKGRTGHGTCTGHPIQDGELPALLNAVELENNGKKLIVEVAQHIGDNVVRCIAMAATDGLVRGTDAVDTGEPIKVPVGDECLGRVFNLLGEPVDEQPAPENIERWPIHRPAPAFDEQESATEILETGIKVVDLICPTPRAARSVCSAVPVSARPF